MTDPAREDRLRDRLAALTPAQRAALEERLGAAQPQAAAAAAAMPASDRYLPFPMTAIQQAYWAGRSSDFEFGKVATHAYVEIDSVDLDPERLNTAWNRLVERHDMLRAIFLPDGTQRVLEAVPAYRIAVEDFRDLPPGAAGKGLAAVRDAMSHQLLPTDRWPIFDIRASLLDGRRVRVHLSFDALIADLSSRRVLMREWGQLYRDAAAELTPLTTTFREIVLAEQMGTASPAYGRARDYWLARVETLPPAPDLPVHEGYNRQQPPVFKRRSRHFDATRKAALDRIARAFGVSLNMLLLTAYTDVLRLWSSSSFTLNLTLFNRPPGDASAAAVVGDFTALTLLEVAAPGEESFAARARRLQDRLWRDLDHRQFSGVDMLREIAHRRSFGGAIMPVVFTSALSGAGNDLGRDLGWMGDETYSVSQTPQVWLDLMAIAMGDGFVIHWNAVEALFPAGLMDDMFGAFCGLLDHLARGTLDGASRWRTIAETLLPDHARLNQGAANATSEPLPTRLLHDPLKDHVATGPDRAALISSALTLSYAELAQLVTNLGHRLRALGVRPNMLVGVVMNKGWEQVAAVLAILESGGAYVPIDPDIPAARLHYLLADAQVSIVLTQPGLIDSLAWPEGIRPIAIAADDRLEVPLPLLQPAQSLSDLAYVIYTSGSTGQPKGVAIDHRGAVNTIEDINARFDIGPSDHVLALSALTFDLSVHDIFGVLAAGGTIILPDPDGARDPAHWAELIARHGVTLWNSVPALMELLVDYAQPRGATFDQLRLVLLSGDRISITLPPAISHIAPAARTVSLGGATEASIWSIWHDTAEVMPGLATIPYGKPMLNQFFRVLSPDMVSCPTWVPGELYIGGIGLAQGYWRDSARTEASFIVRGETGERLYRTGDRGRYLPDGSIEFLGRDDSQIKLRGFRVELGEIESVLAGHPAVREAVVVASGTDSSERVLAAYIVAQATETLGTAEISAWLRDRLPGYMVPAQIILLPHLPLTQNGKVDRYRLSLTDKPPVAPMSSGAVTGPHADRLARLVRQSCRIDIPASDSNFLDLGLTSIDMIRIVNAIDAELGFRPGIEKLYAAPTIDWIAGQYAEWLGGREPDRMTPRHDLKRPGTRAIDSAAPPFVLSANAMPTALADLLRQRRSIRQFALRPIDPDHLGALLAAAMPQDGRYPYGSASGLYPVQTWLHAKAGRVTGLAPGAHHYDPEAHILRPLDADGRLSRSALSPHNAPVIDEAAFILFLVADMEAIEPAYGDRAEHLATLEAGLMTQLFELAAPACGLGLCQIGSADNDAVRALLGLSDRHRLLHMIAGGYPDESPLATMPPDPTEEGRLARLFQRIERLSPEEVRALLGACPGVIG